MRHHSQWPEWVKVLVVWMLSLVKDILDCLAWCLESRLRASVLSLGVLLILLFVFFGSISFNELILSIKIKYLKEGE